MEWKNKFLETYVCVFFILTGLASVQQDLHNIITYTTSLQTLGRKLERDLGSSRKALNGLLQRCPAVAGNICRVVSNSYNINDLRVKSDFSMVRFKICFFFPVLVFFCLKKKCANLMALI